MGNIDVGSSNVLCSVLSGICDCQSVLVLMGFPFRMSVLNSFWFYFFKFSVWMFVLGCLQQLGTQSPRQEAGN